LSVSRSTRQRAYSSPVQVTVRASLSRSSYCRGIRPLVHAGLIKVWDIGAHGSQVGFPGPSSVSASPTRVTVGTLTAGSLPLTECFAGLALRANVGRSSRHCDLRRRYGTAALWADLAANEYVRFRPTAATVPGGVRRSGAAAACLRRVQHTITCRAEYCPSMPYHEYSPSPRARLRCSTR
jgi:hypothetical protein